MGRKWDFSLSLSRAQHSIPSQQCGREMPFSTLKLCSGSPFQTKVFEEWEAASCPAVASLRDQSGAFRTAILRLWERTD